MIKVYWFIWHNCSFKAHFIIVKDRFGRCHDPKYLPSQLLLPLSSSNHFCSRLQQLQTLVSLRNIYFGVLKLKYLWTFSIKIIAVVCFSLMYHWSRHLLLFLILFFPILDSCDHPLLLGYVKSHYLWSYFWFVTPVQLCWYGRNNNPLPNIITNSYD